MKSLNQYIQEKLIINQRFDEKLIINKNYRDNMIVVKSFDELRKIIEDRYNKLGPGTKQDPINFNDIDVSNLNSFCSNDDNGLFEKTKFKYIDISDWDVSNATNMSYMFYMCKELKSVGNISGWDVSNVTDMSSMFYGCTYFNQNISSWDVSNVIGMSYMFAWCESFNQDLSNWNVSKVRFIGGAFTGCSIKMKYKPKFK